MNGNSPAKIRRDLHLCGLIQCPSRNLIGQVFFQSSEDRNEQPSTIQVKILKTQVLTLKKILKSELGISYCERDLF